MVDFEDFEIVNEVLECYRGSDKEITIPEGVTSLAETVFSSNLELESVTIPSSITKIPDSAFRFCENLKHVQLPESILEIGKYSFANCGNLKSITLPSSLKKIGILAFVECKNLTSVNIPLSVQEIGEFAFQGCMIDNLKTNFFTIEDGICFNPEKTEVLYYADGSRTKVHLPSTVRTIGYASFVYFHNLKEIKFPDSLLEIKRESFEECNFTSISIPSSVNKIDHCAFFNCPNMTNVEIKGKQTIIDQEAFVCCDNLNKKSLKTIMKHISNNK